MIKNNKNNIPNLKPGDWILIGEGFSKVPVVVCAYNDSELINSDGDIEIVYLDDRDRAINKGVVWKQDHWEFKDFGPSGGYADKYDRLAEFVRILRRGR